MSPAPATVERNAYSADEIAKRNSVSRAFVWKQMKEGRLAYRKVGTRRLILAEDERAWLSGQLRVTDLVMHERVLELLDYNPVTGEFRWKVNRRGQARAGSIAGSVRPSGHRHIRVDTRFYRAGRLAWLIVHGRWPVVTIDHINGKRDDDRLCNLREASYAENARNATAYGPLGLKGVSYSSSKKKFRAQIRERGALRHLGYFDTPTAAHAAYCAAAKSLHGEFFNPAGQRWGNAPG